VRHLHHLKFFHSQPRQGLIPWNTTGKFLEKIQHRHAMIKKWGSESESSKGLLKLFWFCNFFLFEFFNVVLVASFCWKYLSRSLVGFRKMNAYLREVIFADLYEFARIS